MQKLSPLLVLVGCLVAITIAGCTANGAAPATGSTTSAQGQNALAMRPQYMATRFAARRAMVPDSGLPYQGGPVLLNPKVYLIFWGYKKYGDPDGVAKLLTEYVKVMGGSGHNNIYTQYYDIVDSKTNYITNPRGQLGGVWFDDKNAVPQNPTDAQVAREALNGVEQFGYDANGSYVVATPHGRSTIGFGTQWCANHNATTYSGSDLVSYTNLPYMPDAGEACGADFTAAPNDESAKNEGVTIVEGAQEGDSVTDPNPGTGWYNSEFGEIGGICAWTQIQNDRFGKKSYTMQPMYSYASESCVQIYK
jgi:serine protease